MAPTDVRPQPISAAQPPDRAPRARWTNALFCVLLALSVLIVYWRVGSFEFVQYDDPEYLMHTPHVHRGLTWAGVRWAFAETQVANWHPLTILSYLLDAELFGFAPGAFHRTNLFLHALNTVLLFIVLRRITRADASSAVVAALFGLHPLHVESVAWVAERKDALSTFFWITTTWAYVSWVERRQTWKYALVVLLFGMGLMSKPMLVTLPFTLLLLDVWPLKRIRLQRDGKSGSLVRDIRTLLLEKAPLFAMSLASGAVTFIVQKQAGAVAIVEHLSVPERLANAAIAYVVYLGQMLWPTKLGVLYPLPDQINIEAGILCGVLLLAATVGALVLVGRFPYVTIGWLWYLGTLVPVIGIVQVGLQSRADRYTYVPLIGIFIAIVWAVARFIDQRPRWRMPVAFAALAIIVALSIRTWFQVGHWANSETLFKRTLAVAPANPQIHYNLGTVYSQQQRYPEALGHYRDAVRLEPRHHQAWCNLALTLAARGNLAEAAQVGEEIVRRSPELPDSHVAKGMVAFTRGEVDLADSCAREALHLDAGSHRARILLGKVYSARNQLPSAESEFRRATELAVSVEAQVQLGLILAQQGRTDEAIRHLRQALRWQPANLTAQEALGHALLAQGKTAEARQSFAAVLALNPNARESRLQLGRILTRQGNTAEAIALFKRAIEQDPADAPAHFQLGLLLQQQRDLPEAIVHYRKALSLNPKSSARNNLAWILATSTDDKLRNGREAVALAEQLRQERGDQPEVLDTLAAAYAERGDFFRAAQLAEQAAKRAQAAGNSPLAREVESRAALYRRNTPYREK